MTAAVGAPTWFDMVVFALSMLSASAAFAAFAWAFRAGHPALRAVYAAAAIITAIYVVSYPVVLFGWLVPSEWSKYLRPVSLIYWWVALTAPTCGAVLVHKGTRAGVAEFFGRGHGN